MPPSRTYSDPDVIAKIADLGLRSRRLVEGAISGQHRSPFHGFNVEFAVDLVPGHALRSALADAAGTIPRRVLVSSVHQHDAPVADLEAERLLREAKVSGSVCDLDFHEKAVKGVISHLHGKLSSSIGKDRAESVMISLGVRRKGSAEGQGKATPGS